MKRWILLLSMCVPLAGHRIGAQTTIPQPAAPQSSAQQKELASQTTAADTVLLQLFHDSIGLAEVVVKGKRTPVANSRWSDMHPVELVTVGGANGDLYRALQTLPSTQVQGESGRLLVRGRSSSETQTYMDGMHVLNPYTSTGINSPARGRYSTFMWCSFGVWAGAFGGVAFGDEGQESGEQTGCQRLYGRFWRGRNAGFWQRVALGESGLSRSLRVRPHLFGADGL